MISAIRSFSEADYRLTKLMAEFEFGRRHPSGRHYFFFPEPKVGCQPPVFWLGAAAITLIFSFLGFLASRLPLCWPLVMSISLGLMLTSKLNAKWLNSVAQSHGVSRSYLALNLVIRSRVRAR